MDQHIYVYYTMYIYSMHVRAHTQYVFAFATVCVKMLTQIQFMFGFVRNIQIHIFHVYLILLIYIILSHVLSIRSNFLRFLGCMLAVLLRSFSGFGCYSHFWLSVQLTHSHLQILHAYKY